MPSIDKLTIEGYKSIRKLEDFPLGKLNVLIGANGSGKSNFVSFFRLLRNLVDQRLQLTLATTEGGADGCLFLGPKITPEFSATLRFGRNSYGFKLAPTPDNRLVFAEERVGFSGDIASFSKPLGSGHAESFLKDRKDDMGRTAEKGVPYYVYEAVSSWIVYHFHDTSLTAAVRRPRAINDNESFRPEAENLAPFLYRLQSTDPQCYTEIRDAVRLVAPFFDDFHLRPMPASPDMIQLEWRQRDTDYPFRAHHLSDGTLRFVCLATALLQPSLPSTMLFDEPELGLHPEAISTLGSLFRQSDGRSKRAPQIIVSTQSVQLVNEFEAGDLIIVERHAGESTFRRLRAEELSEWLAEYSLGELWQKNLLGGLPLSDDSPVAVRNSGRD